MSSPFSPKPLLEALKNRKADVKSMRSLVAQLRSGMGKKMRVGAPIVAKAAADLLYNAATTRPADSNDIKRLAIDVIASAEAVSSDETMEFRKLLLITDVTNEATKRCEAMHACIHLLRAKRLVFNLVECHRLAMTFVNLFKNSSCGSEMNRVIEMAGKLSSSLVAWCKSQKAADDSKSLVELLQKVGLYSLHAEWSARVDDEQGLRVLARLILSVPLEEVKSTSAVLPKNLIRLWANEIKKREKWKFVFNVYLKNASREFTKEEVEGLVVLANYELDCFKKLDALVACDYLLNEMIKFYSRIDEKMELVRALVKRSQVTMTLEKLSLAIELCSKAMRLLREDDLEESVGDEMALCHLWLSLYKYEQLDKDTGTVKTLTFDDDDDDDDEAMKGFYWNLKEALEMWETLPSCHSIESTVTGLKIAASLFSLFLQPIFAVRCCFLAWTFSQRCDVESLGYSALLLAASILRANGEVERAYDLIKAAKEHLAESDDIAARIEESKILVLLGKLDDAEAVLVPLLTCLRNEEHRTENVRIAEAQLLGILSDLIGGIESESNMDSSLVDWLREELQIDAVEPVDVLHYCYGRWTCIANLNDVWASPSDEKEKKSTKEKRAMKNVVNRREQARDTTKKKAERRTTKKMPSLHRWTILRETVEIVDKLALLEEDLELRHRVETTLKEAYVVASRFRLGEWRRRFSARLARLATLCGADGKNDEWLEGDVGAAAGGSDGAADETSPIVVKHRLDEEIEDLGKGALEEYIGKVRRDAAAFSERLRRALSVPGKKSKRGYGNGVFRQCLARLCLILSDVALKEGRYDEAEMRASEGILILHDDQCGEKRKGDVCECRCFFSSRPLSSQLFLSLIRTRLDSTQVIHDLIFSLHRLSGRCPVAFSNQVCQYLAYIFSGKNHGTSAFYIHRSIAAGLRNLAASRWSSEIRQCAKEDSSSTFRQNSLLHQKCLLSDVWSDAKDFQTKYVDSLPKGWVVCSISLLSSPSCEHFLAVSRLEANRQSIVRLSPIENHENCTSSQCMCVSASLKSFRDNFESFKRLSEKKSMRRKQKERINQRIEALCCRMEEDWLGASKCLCLGNLDVEDDGLFARCVEGICSKIKIGQAKRVVLEQYVNIILNAWPQMDETEVKEVLREIVGAKFINQIFNLIEKKAKTVWCSTEPVARRPVILILDKSTHMLPWESLGILRGQTISRMPSLGLVFTHLYQMKCRMANSDRTYYVLNAGGESESLEKIYKANFEKRRGWTGITGVVPTQADLAFALSKHDVYLYFGHGNGSQYVHGTRIERMDCKALAVLMGCSSGRLKERGLFEPSGVVHSYLVAGCPAFVGNLWDLTVAEVVHMSDALLERLVESPIITSLPNLINDVREACPFRYLEGATPVCYGLPIFFDHS